VTDLADRYRLRTAVMLFLLRPDDNVNDIQILLQKRQNTGYADGMWDCAASGHVEANESMKMALIREAKEEINISINMEDIQFATLTHKCTPDTNDSYINIYFAAKLFSGVPMIGEPLKCSEIRWFRINQLPKNFLSDRKEALHHYLSNQPYDELDWHVE